MSERLHQGDFLPGFQYDTPYQPGKSIYNMLTEKGPVVMVFLRNFGHPLSRHYIMEYARTIDKLQAANLVCVVRTKPQVIADALQEGQLPYELICDAEGALYEHFDVCTESNWLRSYSLKALKILKKAKKQGFKEKRSEPQQLPLTLVVSAAGEVLFAHYGTSLTDLPEDCAAMQRVVEEILSFLQTMPKQNEQLPMCVEPEQKERVQQEWGQLLHMEQEESPALNPSEEVVEQASESAMEQTEKEAPLPEKDNGEGKRIRKDIDFAKLGF